MKCHKQLPLNARRTSSDTIQTSGFTGLREKIHRSSAPGGIEMSSGYLNDNLEGLYIYVYIYWFIMVYIVIMIT